jgi:Fe-S-cluster containining protein
VSLIGDETERLRRLHGAHTVIWDADEQEWRTNVNGDRCVFLKDNACILHASPEYPAICRGFPYTDGEGGPYLWDRTICPEMKA